MWKTKLPDPAHAYTGQFAAIIGRIGSCEAFQPADGNRDEFLAQALEAFLADWAVLPPDAKGPSPHR